MQDKTRQCETTVVKNTHKTRDGTRQDKAIQDKATQYQNKTTQNNTKPVKRQTRQDNPRQQGTTTGTRQPMTKQGKTWQSTEL